MLLTICLGGVNAQFITNPSFESNTTGTIPPPGWTVCNVNSTPDTQPIRGEVEISPSDGKNFLAMCSRGKNVLQPKNEAAQTYLSKPLNNGGCYSISLDLARAPVEDGSGGYPDAMKLIIWAGKSSCDKNVKLVETEKIRNYDWVNFSYMVYPEDNYTVLILEVVADDNDRGYMAIDNMQLTELRASGFVIRMDTIVKPDSFIELKATKSESYSWRPGTGLTCYECQAPKIEYIENSQTYLCTINDENGCSFDEVFAINIEVYIPNVFTPNNDGINDFFRIDGLKPGSKLTIYNRKGQVVFSDEDYNNDWYGTDNSNSYLPEDTYWYALSIPGYEAFKGYVYIKK